MLTSLKTFFFAFVCCAAIASPDTCLAQTRKVASSAFDISAGYVYEHSNAPPGSCGCFSLNGGFGSFVYNAPHSVGVVADVSVAHASLVGGQNQAITYTNFLFGPRYSVMASNRFVPYGQVLFGGSHESSSVAQANGLTAFALSAGGGATLRLTPHFGVTLLEADWLHSQLFNGGNNRQNALELSAGITIRFGMRQGS